ncbi:MAG: trypsin-like peptidase domain-containing protein [Acholeplasmatales bacterium]|nr:trypsin-like peptidase domain-containing protein [Acholeplasmatales bacterium]
MKKFKGFLLAFLLVLSLSSCRISFNYNNSSNESIASANYSETTDSDFVLPESDNPDGYVVTFDCNNGDILTTTSNSKNTVSNPGTPTKVAATFLGWYSDEDCTKEYNFSKIITSDITIYAGWEQDYKELTNYIYQNTIKANVKIMSVNYKSSFGKKTYASSYSLGSGVIFYETSTCYYVLTNNHVCAVSSGYTGSEYTIYDAYSNEYSATLIGMSADYDLAILRFNIGDESLTSLNLIDHNAKEGTQVIAMGNPLGLNNTINFGELTEYRTYTPNSDTLDLNNVTFSVSCSTAEIDSGSSGGALLDDNLNLIGINFGSATSSVTGEFVRSYAIPVLKIREFINLYLS